ncbi:MAG: hypothetical protein AB9866_20690 [Syntrophobacteraceae bacterium]
MRDCELQKQVYEPPRVTVVHVRLEERVLACLFAHSIHCNLTE